MSYLGNPPKYVNFPSYSNTGDGTTTNYTLTWTPGTANAILVVLGGVVQRPQTDFTVNGVILTFGTAPLSGVAFTVYALGMNATPGVPSDASVTAAKIASGAIEGAMTTPFSHRNKIINGAMHIGQRGTSFTLAANSINYPLDRFFNWQGLANPVSSSQVNDAPAGFTQSLKLTITTAETLASNALLELGQIIEGRNIIDLVGKTFTLSFWVKSSLTGTFSVYFANINGDRKYVAPYTITTANTWEYKTVTVTNGLPADGTWDYATGHGLTVDFILGAGSTSLTTTTNQWVSNSSAVAVSGMTQLSQTTGATWQVTGMQLELGASATPFEYRPIGVEFELCKRYYELLAAGVFAHYTVTTYFGVTANYTVAKRSVPSIVYVSSDQLVNISGTPYPEWVGSYGFRAVASSSAAGAAAFQSVFAASCEYV